MSALLNLSSTLNAYEATAATSNPALNAFNRKRQILGMEVSNPEAREFWVQPGTEKLVFDASKATSVDVTTQFTLAASPISVTRYRFTWTSGNDPVLHASRSLTTSAVALTLVSNVNGTLTVSAAGTIFAAVQVGDTVFVPGPTTGDTSIGFNPANEGFWTVLGVGGSGANVTLVRPTGQTFDAASETVTPSGNALAFAGVGIQVADRVEISGGFSAPVQKTYTVVASTSKWFEVESTTPLAPEAATPGPTGILFYSGAKRIVRVEADQECIVHANGDTGTTQRMAPWQAGDLMLMAEYTKVGPMWKLSVLNKSSSLMKLVVLSCE